ncbi:uncharacterized protein PADG_11169 [Paracoccidioides brasiliensis Pb18]|uniref:Uncharacterized protein n=1 Tax=Paracoccidioides brasiliensis (strain Pb18) TaxID=502780 RepID=A0A0A0HXD8_PARBD|nr:uncharacterized protein PADG_11169 [Paracoccidioides brasiliensis Pb18]KGM92711.1 hypothetical protein PADG_11169 [Paracoccidioides brasiliensis Pb18]ODH49402.1 hypothetical protein GX48_04487 [Paracoccidioides brasiliensis]
MPSFTEYRVLQKSANHEKNDDRPRINIRRPPMDVPFISEEDATPKKLRDEGGSHRVKPRAWIHPPTTDLSVVMKETSIHALMLGPHSCNTFFTTSGHAARHGRRYISQENFCCPVV